MRSPLALCLWFAAVLASAPGSAADGVARVVDVEISRADLAAAGGREAQVARLRDLVWNGVARHYVGEAGLAATREEVAELSAYDREFERKDRAQRARKLTELNQRLAGNGLTSDERAHLEEFRAVLVRLEQRDAESAASARDASEDA